MDNPVKELEEGMEARKVRYILNHQQLMSLYDMYNQRLIEKKFDELKEIREQITQMYVAVDRVKHEWLAYMEEWKAWKLPPGEEG